MSCNLLAPRKFNAAVTAMRSFFQKKGFVEVHTQNALSILAACEDPTTVAQYNYEGNVWPLPQTGQMWLEHVLLENPDFNGCFTVSTSYRNEENPVPGRHMRIFPMFEFESKGDMNDLIKMEKELLQHIGFEKTIFSDGDIVGNTKDYPVGENLLDKLDLDYSTENTVDYPEGDYKDMMIKYNTDELDHDHELQLEKDYGPVFFLKNFPYHTSPFWNMKKNGDISNKVDVILHGVETIGSAERSCNKDEMREEFLTISEGGYSGLLYDKFGKDRVDKEMDAFLDRDFFPRYGGGIGISRMISAMEQSNILDKHDTSA